MDMFDVQLNGMFWIALIVVGACILSYLFSKRK